MALALVTQLAGTRIIKESSINELRLEFALDLSEVKGLWKKGMFDWCDEDTYVCETELNIAAKANSWCLSVQPVKANLFNFVDCVKDNINPCSAFLQKANYFIFWQNMSDVMYIKAFTIQRAITLKKSFKFLKLQISNYQQCLWYSTCLGSSWVNVYRQSIQMPFESGWPKK